MIRNEYIANRELRAGLESDAACSAALLESARRARAAIARKRANDRAGRVANVQAFAVAAGVLSFAVAMGAALASAVGVL